MKEYMRCGADSHHGEMAKMQGRLTSAPHMSLENCALFNKVMNLRDEAAEFFKKAKREEDEFLRSYLINKGNELSRQAAELAAKKELSYTIIDIQNKPFSNN
jgi:hypothetical protein